MAAGEVTVGLATGVTVAVVTGDVTPGVGDAVGRGVGAGVGAGAATMTGAGAGAGASTWGAHCAAVPGAVTTAMQNKACLARCNNATTGKENTSANQYHAMVVGLNSLVLKTFDLDK